MSGEPARRPPWSAFRAALDRARFRPSRRLGQNFLLDEAMTAAIVRDSGVEPGERVVEIGAGCGFLSAHLLERGVRLLSVEIDERLLAVARGFLEPLAEAGPGSLELLHADALGGKRVLGPELAAALPRGEPWSVVANLPYSAGSPLLALFSRLAHPPRRMTVLVQLEVAERLAADPGTRAWGPLGVRLQCLYRAHLVRRVPAQLFWPNPRVESALCRLDLRPERPDPERVAAFDALVGTLFQQRRRILRKALAPLADAGAAEDWARRAGLEPTRRVATLDHAELWRLVEALPGAPGAFVQPPGQ